MESFPSAKVIEQQLTRDLQSVPLGFLDPWFGGSDGIDGNRQDVLAKLEGAARRYCYL